MFRIRSIRRMLAAFVLLAAAGCGGSDGTGPDDDEVFGTYTLVRASGQNVPQALILEADLGFGAIIGTYAQSGSFRISENGTWAFSQHFQQLGVSPDPDLPPIDIEYDVDDSGVYTMQNGIITLDGSAEVTLANGILSRSVFYNLPNTPPTTVVFEFEK